MTAARPARLRVGVIGAGRVGAVLGAALARVGHEVVAVSAISRESLRRAERLLPAAPIRSPHDVVDVADFVLLAVPDDTLRPLVSGLAATDAWRAGQIAAHTSGAVGVGALDPAAARGVLPLALHPVMTFTGRPEDVDKLTGATFGVTAPDELRPVAEALVVELGAEPVWVPELARPLYHAALTVGANHVVTVVNDAMDLLARSGIEQPARLLAPLLTAALDNALRLGDVALTGPISRGDVATVRMHLATLSQDAPETVPSYIAMARRTAERALSAGRLNAEQAQEIAEALS